MRVLVSGATKTIRRLNCENLGFLFTPKKMNDPANICHEFVWAADNAAFSGFCDVAFQKMLDKLTPYKNKNCLFVVAPDVIGDSLATRKKFDLWVDKMQDFPIAYVLQDGEIAEKEEQEQRR